MPRTIPGGNRPDRVAAHAAKARFSPHLKGRPEDVLEEIEDSVVPEDQEATDEEGTEPSAESEDE